MDLWPKNCLFTDIFNVLTFIIFMHIFGFEKMLTCIPFEGGWVCKSVCFVHF